MTVGDSGVSPGLFKYVADYCDSITSGDQAIDEPLDKDNDLLLFSENLVTQLSAKHLRVKITGFNERSEAQLVSERRRLERLGQKEKLQLLLFHLEYLCSKVGEISYSNSEVDAEEFHTYYFPDLLSRVVAWLEELGTDSAARDAAQLALTQYEQTVGQA